MTRNRGKSPKILRGDPGSPQPTTATGSRPPRPPARGGPGDVQPRRAGPQPGRSPADKPGTDTDRPTLECPRPTSPTRVRVNTARSSEVNSESESSLDFLNGSEDTPTRQVGRARSEPTPTGSVHHSDQRPTPGTSLPELPAPRNPLLISLSDRHWGIHHRRSRRSSRLSIMSCQDSSTTTRDDRRAANLAARGSRHESSSPSDASPRMPATTLETVIGPGSRPDVRVGSYGSTQLAVADCGTQARPIVESSVVGVATSMSLNEFVLKSCSSQTRNLRVILIARRRPSGRSVS